MSIRRTPCGLLSRAHTRSPIARAAAITTPLANRSPVARNQPAAKESTRYRQPQPRPVCAAGSIGHSTRPAFPRLTRADDPNGYDRHPNGIVPLFSPLVPPTVVWDQQLENAGQRSTCSQMEISPPGGSGIADRRKKGGEADENPDAYQSWPRWLSELYVTPADIQPQDRGECWRMKRTAKGEKP